MAWTVLAAALALSPVAWGALVTYVDDKGVRQVVQSADDIPEKYRNKAKVIGKVVVAAKADKSADELCSSAQVAEKKAKLTALGKEETQLIASGDPEKDTALKAKLDSNHEQMDQLASEIKSCPSQPSQQSVSQPKKESVK